MLRVRVLSVEGDGGEVGADGRVSEAQCPQHIPSVRRLTVLLFRTEEAARTAREKVREQDRVVLCAATSALLALAPAGFAANTCAVRVALDGTPALKRDTVAWAGVHGGLVQVGLAHDNRRAREESARRALPGLKRLQGVTRVGLRTPHWVNAASASGTGDTPSAMLELMRLAIVDDADEVLRRLVPWASEGVAKARAQPRALHGLGRLFPLCAALAHAMLPTMDEPTNEFLGVLWTATMSAAAERADVDNPPSASAIEALAALATEDTYPAHMSTASVGDLIVRGGVSLEPSQCVVAYLVLGTWQAAAAAHTRSDSDFFDRHTWNAAILVEGNATQHVMTSEGAPLTDERELAHAIGETDGADALGTVYAHGVVNGLGVGRFWRQRDDPVQETDARSALLAANHDGPGTLGERVAHTHDMLYHRAHGALREAIATTPGAQGARVYAWAEPGSGPFVACVVLSSTAEPALTEALRVAIDAIAPSARGLPPNAELTPMRLIAGTDATVWGAINRMRTAVFDKTPIASPRVLAPPPRAGYNSIAAYHEVVANQPDSGMWRRKMYEGGRGQP